MKIFISWSGEKSKAIAAFLKEWLPSVIQALRPFYSSDDIGKGRRWSPELAKELEETEYGIIVLTPDNVKSTFIHFEAGALSKNQKEGHVSTLLFGLKDTDVESPLADFQNTKFTHDDVFKLMQDINSLLGETRLEEKVLERTFEKMWVDFENHVKNVNPARSESSPTIRSDREMLEELLELNRAIMNTVTKVSTSATIPWSITPNRRFVDENEIRHLTPIKDYSLVEEIDKMAKQDRDSSFLDQVAKVKNDYNFLNELQHLSKNDRASFLEKIVKENKNNELLAEFIKKNVPKNSQPLQPG